MMLSLYLKYSRLLELYATNSREFLSDLPLFMYLMSENVHGKAKYYFNPITTTFKDLEEMTFVLKLLKLELKYTCENSS